MKYLSAVFESQVDAGCGLCKICQLCLQHRSQALLATSFEPALVISNIVNVKVVFHEPGCAFATLRWRIEAGTPTHDETASELPVAALVVLEGVFRGIIIHGASLAGLKEWGVASLRDGVSSTSRVDGLSEASMARNGS
jgi:hypothetical protein